IGQALKIWARGLTCILVAIVRVGIGHRVQGSCLAAVRPAKTQLKMVPQRSGTNGLRPHSMGNHLPMIKIPRPQEELCSERTPTRLFIELQQTKSIKHQLKKSISFGNRYKTSGPKFIDQQV
ncbi:hypothetical protein IGI04_019291, partial [Brassica rapa subsp. trilocularis]